MTTGKLESEAWKELYLADVQRERRMRAMPAKMARLGLKGVSRDAKILDLCCGSGETLVTLYEMGFRDLSGVDLTIPDDVIHDTRFNIGRGDALDTRLPANQYDWVLNVHAMHHFASARSVDRFLEEACRLLKPGGKLGIIDFSNTPQIRLAFWFFRQNVGLITPYLKYFGKLIQEEWYFLEEYLRQWPQIRSILRNDRFRIISQRRTLFYFYLVLQKPFYAEARAQSK